MSDAIATHVEPQFEEAEQQREAATMGMWLFLATEVLLFGGNFHIEASDPKHAELFFYIYWLMTGVHALHVAIGVLLITIFALRAWFANAFRDRDTPVDLLGLYWHFVDIVWVFLFPLIYLV